MGISGNSGFYGIATQADKDTFQATLANYVWFEALTAPFNIAEQARTRRPTIGDDPYPRGAYKAGAGPPGSSRTWRTRTASSSRARTWRSAIPSASSG